MKLKKPKKQQYNKQRKNNIDLSKISIVTLSKIQTDGILIRNFGLLGFGLAEGNKEIRNFLVKCSGINIAEKEEEKDKKEDGAD